MIAGARRRVWIGLESMQSDTGEVTAGRALVMRSAGRPAAAVLAVAAGARQPDGPNTLALQRFGLSESWWRADG